MSPDERTPEHPDPLDDPGNEDPGSQFERQAPQREDNAERTTHDHEMPVNER